MVSAITPKEKKRNNANTCICTSSGSLEPTGRKE
jgi:hypothetical protein